VRAPGLRLVNNAGVESARTRKSEALGIIAGTLKNGPDVYCVDDSEIMRERQYMSQLRELSELVGFGWLESVWADTRISMKGSVADEDASVGS